VRYKRIHREFDSQEEAEVGQVTAVAELLADPIARLKLA